MFVHFTTDGNTPEFVDADSMGRAASKIEGFKGSLAAASRAVSSLHVSSHSYWAGGSNLLPPAQDDSELKCSVDVGCVDAEVDSNVKSLIASRLSLPERPSFYSLPF